MGFFDAWDGASVISSPSTRHSKHHKSSSHKSTRKRSRSRDSKHHTSGGSGASIVGGVLGAGGNYSKNSASKSSFFNLGNNSSRSLFSGQGGRSSSSFYRRQPRANFIQRAVKYLKKLLRDLVYYAKRHPLKVFMIVIMPLITGGALTALLATFGLRLPPAVERMLGIAARGASGGGAGLVGEAVRMASNLGGGGGTAFAERGHSAGGVSWERRGYEALSSGDGGGGGGFLNGVKNFFS